MKIDDQNIAVFCRELAAKDSILASVFSNCGVPPVWSRPNGYSTLVQIILEQQVSLASAKAAFDKCSELVGEITPEKIVELSDEQMRSIYFSRQKAGYVRNLAVEILSGALDLDSLEHEDDHAVRAKLMKIKGVGQWTSDIYLLMAMSRPDIMPKGDLALHAAWQKLNNLAKRPESNEFLQIAERWKPLRSVAARLLWHFYLTEKR